MGPYNFYALILHCVDSIEAQLAKKADAFTEEAETVLANALFILSYLFAALPAATARGSDAEAGQEPNEAANVSFAEKLWQAPENGLRPLGERVADAVMRSLFHDGFTIDGPDLEDSEAPEMVNGVVPALIWQEGVGPEGSSQPKNEMQENRVVALQLLVAFLSGGAPSASVLQVPEHPEDGNDNIDAKLSRLVILDPRPLAYLSDASRTVPFRGELFFSLMSVALGYDPHGFGVPYGGYFAGAKQEAFAHVCLQALGLLLQDMGDAADSQGDLAVSSSLVAKRPQELLVSTKSIPEEEGGGAAQNFFREMLGSISSASEVEFMVEGVVKLLGTVGKERKSYLPSSMRLPPFLPELLVLVLHLTACPKFVAGACAEEDVVGLIEGVLLAASQAPQHVCETTLSLIEAAILLNLTSYREVCVQLDEDFEGNLPESIPDFEGSAADFVAMAALTQASEYLNKKSKASKVHESIVQMSLATLANVSTFADGFCIELCSRLFSLFERCAKSLQAKRDRQWLGSHIPILLEAFDNALQYKYSGNMNLAYGLMTRQAIFRDLVSTVPQVSLALTAPDEDAQEMTRQWQQAVEAHLLPVAGLLDATVPILEAQVEKHEISNSEEAKELLPRCILGLMPPPHAFQMRHLQRCAATHVACEHLLAASVGDGPYSPLWEVEETTPNASQASRGRGQEAKSESQKARRERSGSRARSSSRSRGAKALSAKGPVTPNGCDDGEQAAASAT
ncbi:unnamed protein product [Effrenium voratum]|nr:unnamed protein product [Effrenium voratum]